MKNEDDNNMVKRERKEGRAEGRREKRILRGFYLFHTLIDRSMMMLLNVEG
jgi:hypothetical protein